MGMLILTAFLYFAWNMRFMVKGVTKEELERDWGKHRK